MSKQYSLVGSNFAKAEDFVKTLAAGTAVTLVREPKNAFDPNAVAVYVDQRKIGYIPKKQNAVLAQLIDQNGREWQNPDAETMAMDEAPNPYPREISGTFVRSPNSGFPMIVV